MVKSRDVQLPTTARRERAAVPVAAPVEPEYPAPPGEDVVVSQISYVAPSPAGHRRLVDQVPPEIRPRATNSARPDPSLTPVDVDERPVRPTRLGDTGADETGPAPAPTETVRLGRERLSRRSIRIPASEDPVAEFDDGLQRDRAEVASGESQRHDRPGRDDRRDREPRREEHHSGSPVAPRLATPEPVWRASSDADTIGEAGPDVLRGLRPAPIPGPVPVREFRRDAPPPADRPLTRVRMADASEPDTARIPARPPSAPRPQLPRMEPPSGELDRAGGRPAPVQRPVLPDLLPDDAFSRVPRDASSPDLPVDRRAGAVASPQRPLVPDRNSPARRPEHGPSARSSWDDAGGDAGTESARPEPRRTDAARARPALPRMASPVKRPTPPPVRTVPTVAEANRAIGERYEAPSGHQPSTRSSPPGAARHDVPAPRGANRGGVVVDGSPRVEDRLPASALLQPPTPLRPAREDFGAYATWLNLQSVEPRLSPHLQRACETCRDFRPSENGERGWCTNPDAFTLRTVVNAGDLPCISSFGCWWVPFDDVWLSEAAIRDHANPTPLLDQFFSEEEQGIVGRHRRRS